jgi:hypothetical protein
MKAQHTWDVKQTKKELAYSSRSLEGGLRQALEFELAKIN